MKNTYPHSHRHKALYLLALTVVAAAAWAWFAEIELAVDAAGRVQPRGETLHVVADAGGRVMRIAVHDGAVVRQGDVLVQLDTRELMLRRRTLLARIQMHESAELYCELEELQFALERLTIVSPGDGRVAALAPLHVGDVVTAGAAIAALAPATGDRVIESWLPPQDRRWVQTGSQVRIQLPESEEILDGSVETIEPDNRVLIRVDHSEFPLWPGTPCQIHFLIRKQRLLSWFFGFGI